MICVAYLLGREQGYEVGYMDAKNERKWKMSDNNGATGGLGLTSVLGVVFVVLKLTHTIDWSWVWVTSPFWMPAAVFGVLFLVAILASAILSCFGKTKYGKPTWLE